MKCKRDFLTSSQFLCISFGCLFISYGVADIPLGSKLSALDSRLWVSHGGNFALGFYSSTDQPYEFSVGIRFHSKLIPAGQQTVVWVAGADVKVSNSSYFQLTLNGELVLFDFSKGVRLWRSRTTKLSVASALLRDDGNFVLLNDKKDVVWQSFDTPSDTLLPGQVFSASQTLRAASRNSISSYYTLDFVSGQLQLTWETSVIFWTSESSLHPNVSAVLNSNGTLQLLVEKERPVWSVHVDDHDDSVDFRFLRLDVDGNLRIYTWSDDLKSWISVWQAVENQCDVFATCDQQGICAFNATGFPICECPFKNTEKSNSKCLLSSEDGCSRSGSIMFEYANMFLYGFYPANDSIVQTSLEQCKSMCLEDSSCTSVTFRNDGTLQCRIKRTQYVSGYSDPSISSVSFVKKCSDPIAADTNSGAKAAHGEHHRLSIYYVIGAAAGSAVVLLALQFGIGLLAYKRRNSCRKNTASAIPEAASKCLIMLSFTEVKELTGNFGHPIGPTMYKGMLCNNQPVAVKKLEASVEARKFRVAVSQLRNIHHKRIIKFEGYCCELDHRYLVYEYAPNGSLEKYMEDSELSKMLPWRKRVNICLSVGKAISYLHSECREFLSHGNLKCENIVLDENLDAKVTDFGLGMLRSRSPNLTSAEKDIADFGRMMLTLVTGCRNSEEVMDRAYKEWSHGHPESILDRRLEDDGEVELEELERLLRITFWCLQSDEQMRPSLGEVVKVLEGTLSVDPPPPVFSSRGQVGQEETSAESAVDVEP